MTLYPDVFNPRWEEGFHCMAEGEVKQAGSNYRDMTDVPTEELRALSPWDGGDYTITLMHRRVY